MISEAAIIAQKTSLELRTVYGWLYKHQEPRERIKSYAEAGGWGKIRDCIERDKPIEWIVAGAALDTA